MKIIIFLSVFVIALTACGSNLPYEQENKKIIHEEKIKKTPVYTEQEITVGEAYTKIIDTGVNRVNNITLACNSISGIALAPQEEFSFNNIVGKRTKERGYKKAPVIFHGEKSYGTGGGVCQVSSTLYMAVLNADLKVTERHPHSETVAYAPGTDATVVFGEKDFKFLNNTEDTLYLYLWVQDENAYAKIIKKESVFLE